MQLLSHHTGPRTERHGELVIIALGETIIQLVLTEFHATPKHYAICVASFLLVFCIQLLYFEMQPPNHHDHALNRGIVAKFFFIFSHAIIQFGLLGVGVGIKLFLKKAPGE